SWSQPEVRAGAPSEGIGDKRLTCTVIDRQGIGSRYARRTERWTKYRCSGNRSDVWTRWGQNNRRSTAQQCSAKESLGIRQIEAGQVLWIINLDAAISVGLEEELQMIVQSNVEACRPICNIDVTGITVVI